MKRNFINVFIWIFLTGFFLAFFAKPSDAIPVFARKYKTSCVTCHEPFPRLNAFGEAFRLRGYRFINDEEFVKEEPVSLGEEAYKKVWPDAVWPSDIPGNAPLAISIPFEINKKSGVSSKTGVEWDFSFPKSISLLAGGTLGKDMGFWAHIVAGSSSASFHRTFFLWNGIGKEYLNLRIGQLEPGFMPYSAHRKLPLTDYLPGTYTVGSSTFSPEHFLNAIEFYGIIQGKFAYWSGFTTGTDGKDDNSAKDFYFRLAYKLGKIGLDGTYPGMEQKEGEENLAQPTEDKFLTLGLSGYFGSPHVSIGGATTTTAAEHVHKLQGKAATTGSGTTTITEFDEDATRWGVDAHLKFKNSSLLGHYVFGKDTNAFNDANKLDVKSKAWFVEGSHEIKPWLFGALRYEELEIEDKDNSNDIKRVVPTLSALLRANVKFTVERPAYIKGWRAGKSDELLLNLWMAF